MMTMMSRDDLWPSTWLTNEERTAVIIIIIIRKNAETELDSCTDTYTTL